MRDNYRKLKLLRPQVGSEINLYIKSCSQILLFRNFFLYIDLHINQITMLTSEKDSDQVVSADSFKTKLENSS